MVNHWWQVPLYVSVRGLTTSAMPYGGRSMVEVEFDFLAHQLEIRTSEGGRRTLPLAAAERRRFLLPATAASARRSA